MVSLLLEAGADKNAKGGSYLPTSYFKERIHKGSFTGMHKASKGSIRGLGFRA